ncbi:MAG: hypothetical protein KAR09_00915, partial [Bacteroidales bacterium]|nr:hypothetical protein [Bacteroidales bacterium]
MPPVISEFYYNEGAWQLEIYFDSEVHGIYFFDSFDNLCLKCAAGDAFFNPGIPFTWDSLYVIDQSWLTSVYLINPSEDQLNMKLGEGGGYDEFCEGIYYGGNSSLQYTTPPGPGESIAVQYFNVPGEYPSSIQMKQSPPTIGIKAFEVDSRCSFSGFVFDQFQNPVPDVEFVYCDPSYCNGYVSPPFFCFQTDETGYFETDSLFPMWHNFELTLEGYIFVEHEHFFEPNQPLYMEYILNSVGISVNEIAEKINILAAPNPFTHKTTFHLSIPDELAWNEARITLRNINGQIIDFIPLTNALWAGNDISVDWYTENANAKVEPGLYLYTLEIEGRPIASNKLIVI